MAGGGAGAMVFSILFRMLIECYQWRGALVLTAAIVLNCCVAGSILFPVSFWMRGDELTRKHCFNIDKLTSKGLRKKDYVKPVTEKPVKKSVIIGKKQFERGERLATETRLLNKLSVIVKNSQELNVNCEITGQKKRQVLKQNSKSLIKNCVNVGQCVRKNDGPSEGEKEGSAVSSRSELNGVRSGVRTESSESSICNLFMDISFILFSFNSFLLCFGSTAVFIVLVDYAADCDGTSFFTYYFVICYILCCLLLCSLVDVYYVLMILNVLVTYNMF